MPILDLGFNIVRIDKIHKISSKIVTIPNHQNDSKILKE
ncbi:hypothetical protein AO385_2002 [Moraxella catarrhalis]|uniref:Uncharacterized protein n=1 Tax=Moraxella catarrhalis TaxID=480 RepID=A0A198UDX1_MORCA|nr:hypothetical protein AO384_1941 [Moraxella catarrhalis]OAU95578.1 hypothetical protein AO385_2002 [Moraxella catarrhalis]OAU96812.1 hypothetical protein AO383_1329 [Moraxella catarrhalis]